MTTPTPPPPSFLTLMKPQTILIKVNFERLKLIISLRFLDGNFLCNLSVYSLMLWCKNILVFSRNSFFIWNQKNVNLHKFLNTQICTYCKSLSFNPAAVYFLFETIFAFFKDVTWKEKELIGGKFVLCYSEARNRVSHSLVHNSSQVYFQLFSVVFIRKSYKSIPLQSIKHQHPTGNINL